MVLSFCPDALVQLGRYCVKYKLCMRCCERATTAASMFAKLSGFCVPCVKPQSDLRRAHLLLPIHICMHVKCTRVCHKALHRQCSYARQLLQVAMTPAALASSSAQDADAQNGTLPCACAFKVASITLNAHAHGNVPVCASASCALEQAIAPEHVVECLSPVKLCTLHAADLESRFQSLAKAESIRCVCNQLLLRQGQRSRSTAGTALTACGTVGLVDPDDVAVLREYAHNANSAKHGVDALSLEKRSPFARKSVQRGSVAQHGSGRGAGGRDSSRASRSAAASRTKSAPPSGRAPSQRDSGIARSRQKPNQPCRRTRASTLPAPIPQPVRCAVTL